MKKIFLLIIVSAILFSCKKKEVEPNRTFTVSVVDVNQNPVSGIVVDLSGCPWNHGEIQRVVSGSDGRVTFQNLKQQVYSLAIDTVGSGYGFQANCYFDFSSKETDSYTAEGDW